MKLAAPLSPLRLGLIALAIGVAAYFLWCAVADIPSHWSARVLLCVVLVGAPLLTRWERRRFG